MKNIFFFSAGMLILSIAGILFMNLVSDSRPSHQNGDDPSPSPSFIDPALIHSIYPDRAWERANENSPFSEEGFFEVYYSSGEMATIPVSGVGWTTQDTVDINTSGWVEEVTYEGVILRGASADGPGTSIESFIRIEGNTVQLQTISKDGVVSKAGAGETTIFLSYPVDINGIW